jgi:hypothetical protein
MNAHRPEPERDNARTRPLLLPPSPGISISRPLQRSRGLRPSPFPAPRRGVRSRISGGRPGFRSRICCPAYRRAVHTPRGQISNLHPRCAKPGRQCSRCWGQISNPERAQRAAVRIRDLTPVLRALQGHAHRDSCGVRTTDSCGVRSRIFSSPQRKRTPLLGSDLEYPPGTATKDAKAAVKMSNLDCAALCSQLNAALENRDLTPPGRLAAPGGTSATSTWQSLR